MVEDRTGKVRKLVTSPAVIPLERGDYPSRPDCLELIASLPLLAVEPAVIEIAEASLRPPRHAGGPGRRRASSCPRLLPPVRLPRNLELPASRQRKQFGHIRRVNTLLGLYVPALVTPLKLLAEYDDEA